MLDYDRDVLDCYKDTEINKNREVRKGTVVSSDYTISSDCYSRNYVKGLEQELQRLMRENLYLKSDEYINQILAERPNDDLKKQNELMTKKINFLTLIIRELSHNAINREDILCTLKAILDGDFSEFKQSTISKDNNIYHTNVHQLAQYISLKHSSDNTRVLRAFRETRPNKLKA
jgi:hypothetical protein